MARLAAAWVGVAVLSVFSGIAATSLFPTVVQTSSYQAAVRLSLQPRRNSSIHASTLFGDLDLWFRGWSPAPGIDVVPQLRASITDLIAGGDTSIARLRPTTAELDDAIWAAGVQVGLRFAVGVAVVLALALLVVRLRRRRQPWRAWLRSAALPVSAVLVASLATGGSMAATYQPGNMAGTSTSGLISVAMSDARLLSTVQSRAVEVTPYVRNMLALSTALQERYAGGTLTTNTPVKIVVVSDLHGADQYPLLKAIVEAEHATAVIDAGDLVNFGRVAELRTGGDLLAGIRSLGVPYFFVRGNHDASSPGDEQILRAVASVPNAVVLQPDADHYTIAQIAGLRIAGFNDPRWFGDGGKDAAAAQVPAAQAFQGMLDEQRTLREEAAASASASASASSASASSASATASTSSPPSTTTASGSPSPTTTAPATAPAPGDPLDIIVGHEPAAVEPITGARLRLNGHLHSTSLNGNRIGAGTFTGGGIMARYIEESDGELQGQPYAFDVLSFGTDCSLASLTRYEFRNLVEGRPVYDGVRVINGATIQSPAMTPGRSCLPQLPLTRHQVRYAALPNPAASVTASTAVTTGTFPTTTDATNVSTWAPTAP